MKQILTISLLLITLNLWSQEINFTAVVEEFSNNTTEVQLQVCGFDDMVSFQFTLSYDSIALEYVNTVEGEVFSIVDFSDSTGYVVFLWVHDDPGSGQTMADCERLLTLQFNGTGADPSSFQLVDELFPIEITNTDGLMSYTYKVGECPPCTLPPTAISEPLLHQNIDIFPNPVTSQRVLTIVGAELETGTFILYDLHGKLVLDSSIKTNQITFDNSRIPVGIYFYQITLGNSTSHSGKLVFE